MYTSLCQQINDAGNVLMDVWVRPKEAVTDFRYHVTGIHWSDLKDGISPEEASSRMHELTSNATLVGHALHNDIKVNPSLWPCNVASSTVENAALLLYSGVAGCCYTATTARCLCPCLTPLM